MFEWSSTTERLLRPIHSELLRLSLQLVTMITPPGLHKNSSEPDGEFPYQRYFKVLSLLVLHNEADATR